jgi:hypothetical protein
VYALAAAMVKYSIVENQQEVGTVITGVALDRRSRHPNYIQLSIVTEDSEHFRGPVT